ncbi:hypothetical protein P7C71_g5934, partial [Lecanoromycetidae sp. Uapishka_2]
MSFFKKLTSFNNEETTNWPTYPDGDVLWSVRTFRTTDCGDENGFSQTGSDPMGNTSNVPFMMSEYKSTNFKYHDNKPCENFMFMDPSKIGGIEVQSVAVWLSASVENAYTVIYTSNVCDATVINDATESEFSSEDSNLVYMYNGTGALYQGLTNDSIVGDGVWACVKSPGAVWNAFSVVQYGTTDMTVPGNYYVNGHIPGSETQPKNRAPGQHANTYKHDAWAAYTWEQVGPDPPNTGPTAATLPFWLSTGGD